MGGTITSRAFDVSSRLALVFLGLAFTGTTDAQKQPSRSPHGPLAIPCENCHTNASWAPIRAVPEFNHDSTRYPLRAAHEKVYCAECHLRPVFADVGKNCADCHADIHRRKFGANCSECHTDRGWQVSVQSVRGHMNRFPLIGAHAAVECESCHKSAAVGQFQGLSTACLSCHLRDFQRATNPSHVAMNFPASCESCHSSDSWVGAKFDHLKATGFALTGAHATLECTLCHVGGKFNGTPTDCASCHIKDFNRTTNPNHVQAGIPTTCSICHTTIAWSTATFDHSKTVFPLTGAHISVPCASCHISSNFASTPTDCYSCHKALYTATTNPNHIAAGFPTTCQGCHTTSSWLGAAFNHSTFFRLPHSNAQCADCHINSANFVVFSCTANCHAKSGTDSNHRGVSAYVYSPTSCYTCHRNGGGG